MKELAPRLDLVTKNKFEVSESLANAPEFGIVLELKVEGDQPKHWEIMAAKYVKKDAQKTG